MSIPAALTPMLVQYLVGLCCLRWDPEAIDIIIGDMVLDKAAGKERDVDVTVTVAESEGSIRAFKAYEVKREGTPLDVADVEQLCLKLLDMPSLTHRAIVSSSGFTEGAQQKASSHGVELFALQPWTRPLQEQFPLLTMKGTAQEHFRGCQCLLCWLEPRYALVALEARGSFNVQTEDSLFDASGQPHAKYATFGGYQRELLLRSTEILFPLEPAATVLRTFPLPFGAPKGVVPSGPGWPHTHTLDVTGDDVYVQTESGLCHLNYVTITGYLQWQRGPDPVYYVMECVPGGDAFAGAVIYAEKREGHMTALVYSPKTREIGVHFVRLAEKHQNAIRKLSLLAAHVDARQQP
jgi:hypothetical protein